jgi:hypothetical protein
VEANDLVGKVGVEAHARTVGWSARGEEMGGLESSRKGNRKVGKEAKGNGRETRNRGSGRGKVSFDACRRELVSLAWNTR